MNRFRCKQDGEVVASVEADDRDRAISQIDHYVWQYASEGEVVVQELVNGRWRNAEYWTDNTKEQG